MRQSLVMGFLTCICIESVTTSSNGDEHYKYNDLHNFRDGSDFQRDLWSNINTLDVPFERSQEQLSIPDEDFSGAYSDQSIFAQNLDFKHFF